MKTNQTPPNLLRAVGFPVGSHEVDQGANCFQPSRPMLRYHGGKWKLAKWIISHFPPHVIYTEAFAGSASVLLQKPRADAEIINDLNDDLVGLFSVLRDAGTSAELRRALYLTPYAYTEFRRALEPATDPVEKARRLVVASFMSVGTDGTTRGSSAGFRNYSKVDRIGTIPVAQWPSYVDNLSAITKRLSGVIIECRDAAHVIRQHDSPSTLHYVDPPYVHSSRSANGRGKYRFEMTDDQHRELAMELQGLSGKVVLSGYHSPLYDELFSGWRSVERTAQADGARDRTEVLWMNFKPDTLNLWEESA